MKIYFLHLAWLFLLFSFSYQQTTYAFPGEIVDSLKSPGYFPTGLTSNGSHLFLADRKTDLIYVLDPSNGEVLRTLETPGYWTMGLCFDGEALYCADIRGGIDEYEYYEGKIYRIDPVTGIILKTLSAPGSRPSGLAFDGTYLWCVDNRSDMVIQFDPDDGTTISAFPAPAKDPQGLTFDGRYLYITDRAMDEIYMVDPKTGFVIQILQAPGPYPRGITIYGDQLFVVDYQTDYIYKLTLKDDEQYRTYDEKKGRLVFTNQIKNFGPGTVLSADFYMAEPQDLINQEIPGTITYSTAPDDFVTDRWGQRSAHFRFTGIDAGETIIIERSCDVMMCEVRWFIFPEDVKPLSEMPPNVSIYLEDNNKYRINHPIIKEAVKDAIGDETNPYWIARKIYQYVIANMYYEMTGGWNTAPTVLARGNGSCSEYTFVLIAMLRSAGIPARYAGSIVVRGDDASFDEVFHRWVEIFLPGYGWLPIDGNRGDKDLPRNQAAAFGYLPNSVLITTLGGGGSEFLEWTYNSNIQYTSEPKTNINTEHFGDWEPLNQE